MKVKLKLTVEEIHATICALRTEKRHNDLISRGPFFDSLDMASRQHWIELACQYLVVRYSKVQSRKANELIALSINRLGWHYIYESLNNCYVQDRVVLLAKMKIFPETSHWWPPLVDTLTRFEIQE